jgi:hypothetical protein
MSIGEEIAKKIAEDVMDKKDYHKERDTSGEYDREEPEMEEEPYSPRGEWARKAKQSAAKKAINAFKVEDADMLLAALDEIREIDRE